MEWSYIVQDLMIGWIVIFSLALSLIGFLSFRRSRNPRLGRVFFAFVLFFVKGSMMAFGIYTGRLVVQGSAVYILDASLFLDLAILLLLYFAVFRK